MCMRECILLLRRLTVPYFMHDYFYDEYVYDDFDDYNMMI